MPSVIHLNIVDFAVAVERSRDPSLRSKPVIVSPLGAGRSLVYDMSEEAYRAGVKKGMPLKKARHLVPEAALLVPCRSCYENAMKVLAKQTKMFTPLVQSGPDDGHVFMDVSGTSRLFGPPEDIAAKLRRQIKKDTGFDPVWSVAANRLVAKVASRMAKPCGEYIVPQGAEQRFLSPLPVALLPGISRPEVQLLNECNIRTVSQARQLALADLEIPFEKRAGKVFNILRGIDRSRISVDTSSDRSISSVYEFSKDTNCRDDLKGALHLLVARCGTILRERGLESAKLCIRLYYCDGLSTSVQVRQKPPVANDIVIYRQAVDLLGKGWKRRVRVRHVALSCDAVPAGQIQMSLFQDHPPLPGENRKDRLVAVLDRIRTRFGQDSVKSGLSWCL